jgi:hypothetical protein
MTEHDHGEEDAGSIENSIEGGGSGKLGALYLVLVRRSYLEWLGRNGMNT